MKRQWGWNRNSYMYSRAETAQPLWFWVCHTMRETNRTSRNDIPISQLFTKKVCFRDRRLSWALSWDSWFAGCEINLLVMRQDQIVNPCSSVILAGQIRVTSWGGTLLAGWCGPYHTSGLTCASRLWLKAEQGFPLLHVCPPSSRAALVMVIWLQLTMSTLSLHSTPGLYWVSFLPFPFLV